MQGIQRTEKTLVDLCLWLDSGLFHGHQRSNQLSLLSTIEAEYVATTSCACQAIWLSRLLEKLHCKKMGSTLVYCDNSSTIKLPKTLVLRGRSKHIDVKVSFLE